MDNPLNRNSGIVHSILEKGICAPMLASYLCISKCLNFITNNPNLSAMIKKSRLNVFGFSKSLNLNIDWTFQLMNRCINRH
jgi:hypothetical protein